MKKNHLLFAWLLMASFFLVSFASAQPVYVPTNTTVSVTNIDQDENIANFLKSGGYGWTPAPGTIIQTSQARPWTAQANLVLTVDKTFQCLGQSTNKLALVPGVFAGNGLQPKRINLLDLAATTAYMNGYKLKVGRIVCGTNPGNSNEKYAYIFDEDDLVVVPGSSGAANSSWINGVVVNDGGAAPANPVSTNWGFEIATAGTYEIYAHWVANKNTVTNVSYAFDGQAATSANLDQNISSGIWVKLGANKTFTTGSHNVTISVDPTAFYVVDGIKVELAQ